MRVSTTASLGLVAIHLLAAPAVVGAHEGDPPPTEGTEGAEVPLEAEGEVITIVEEVPLEEASEERITAKELRLFPHRTPGQLLGAAPGLFVGQHAGGGKADQIFMRGFDADHGTDVALYVDGVPVNLPSHAHGQGYADLHFIIPEVIDHLHVAKGPYQPDAGDFATGGSIRLHTIRYLRESFLTAEAGSFETLRLVGATGGTRGPIDGWIAAEAYQSNGPFDAAQKLRRHNLIGKMTLDLGDASDVWLEVTSYGGGWNASGQIPLRAVEAGLIDRFGAIDPTEGGVSARQSAIVGWISHPAEGKDDLELRAYMTRYRLDLWSNFTFFLDDPVNGDGIEQVDDRSSFGFFAEHRRRRELGCLHLGTRLGIETRDDGADVALYSQRARERLGVRNAAHIEQSSLGAWAEVSIGRNQTWKIAAGGRVELFAWTVDDAGGDAENGSAKRAIAVPKLRAEATVLRTEDVALALFLDAGGGYHSNDARNVVGSGAAEGTLPRAWGADVGGRVRGPHGRWEAALSGWGLWLEDELVWIGDAGGVEPRGATRRLGFDVLGRLRILPWLGAEVEASYSHARFENGDRVPLAPTLLLAAGLAARHPLGISGSLRVRLMADRPANEADTATAEGYSVADLVLSYRRGEWQAELAVDNLTNASWREAQFYFESRLAGESAGVEDIHFTPGVPLSGRLSLTRIF